MGTLSDDSGNVIELIKEAYEVRIFQTYDNKYNM